LDKKETGSEWIWNCEDMDKKQRKNLRIPSGQSLKGGIWNF
jgi:hypothetical protein